MDAELLEQLGWRQAHLFCSVEVDASFRRLACVVPCYVQRNSYLLPTEFTSVRDTISREQRKEVNQHASDKTPSSDACGDGFARRRRRGDRERGDVDLLDDDSEFDQDRSGKDNADSAASRCERVKELPQHVVPTATRPPLDLIGDGRVCACGQPGALTGRQGEAGAIR
jgi:hypothetical protein